MRKIGDVIIFDTEDEASSYFDENYMPAFYDTPLGEPFKEKVNE